ncbi:GNAT family N-acetyltransferase [Aureimonas flava]|uniref:GNAT family N-acetyltransferase n=1 Tax=Aureimonas flava TaxID=2320271 RepID=A0A3A1WT01_9HYPH|nr:GNAT family N-acetyltransferase [Aureimonas flava]RIY03721.1 GNAT family N-acetyltransferase [Aureimonas flava]
MTVYFVRTAGARDMAAVGELLRETWHATYDPIHGAERVAAITTDRHGEAVLRARLSEPDTEFLVADDGTRLGGMAFARASAGDRTLVTLHQLYVRPEAQGQGIGTDLLGEIAGCFPQATRIRVEVDEANARAIGFYVSQGFAQVGRSDDGSGLPAVVLERPLGAFDA